MTLDDLIEQYSANAKAMKNGHPNVSAIWENVVNDLRRLKGEASKVCQ